MGKIHVADFLAETAYCLSMLSQHVGMLTRQAKFSRQAAASRHTTAANDSMLKQHAVSPRKSATCILPIKSFILVDNSKALVNTGYNDP